MKIRQIFCFHDWTSDCKICSKCGEKRQNKHNWSENCEKCSICGKEISNNHDWSRDCGRCLSCGQRRNNKHDWSSDCCTCSICKKKRNPRHNWVNGKCSVCGNAQDPYSRFIETIPIISNQAFTDLEAYGYYNRYEDLYYNFQGLAIKGCHGNIKSVSSANVLKKINFWILHNSYKCDLSIANYPCPCGKLNRICKDDGSGGAIYIIRTSPYDYYIHEITSSDAIFKAW